MAGEGNIVANPLFVDESNGDYHLALGSPCFDAGTISNVNCLEDMDGKQRIKGRSIDLGCYEFQDVPEMPIIIPSTGTIIAGTTNVVISCSTDDATIYYTTDGSEPTVESTVYRRFRVLGRTTVKAVAIKNGVASKIAVAEYAVGQCADPVITPVDGVEFEHVGQAVTIAWSGEDGVLRYTTDG
ncbi:MAG: chitobiase/beta-hexosaminidase C-terminal domain-containing protein, partial [Bacteroidaceae bacterium]|nr:chitobiase/beta-hexosaminidase C-terminal domain-containing protein [Bacteroidaceae bacterium]